MCARLHLQYVFMSTHASKCSFSGQLQLVIHRMHSSEEQWDVGHVYLFIFASKEVQVQDKIPHDRSEMRSLSAGERCSLHGAS